MATIIRMPQMGYDMREGTVVKWHKKEGESVARGEIIADIETDKATVEFEAYAGGVLRKIVAPEGSPVPVGELIAVITEPNEEMPADLSGNGAPAAAPEEAPAPQQAPTSGVAPAPAAPTSVPPADVAPPPAPPTPKPAPRPSGPPPAPPAPPAPPGSQVAATGEGGRILASPLARRIAQEKGIDLSRVKGSGPNGRITEKDVEVYAAAPQVPAAPAPVAAPQVPAQTAANGAVPVSRMRQAIARVTTGSKREAPHFYVAVDVDMTRAMSLRREINEALTSDERVSVNDIIIKAAAVALQHYPKFNAFYRGETLEMHAAINIGVAIALEAGLMVPGVLNCEIKTLKQISAAAKDLGARARAGSLKNEEYNTTFSISNLGMFGVDSFTAIIYPPHAAVLAVGAVKEAPVVRNGEIKVAQVMTATLSVDHRVADGAEAAEFLMEIKKLLESPLTLLL